MYPYRCFVKDCLDLSGLPIANSVCLTFNISKDLLSTATSSFTLVENPTNIKEGDVLGLVDPYGTIIYTGVINSIGDSISCRGITALFNDNWKYHDVSPTTIEGKIKKIIEDDFINSSDPMVSDRFPFTVTASSSTTGTIETKDDTAVMDFETFLMNMYNTYGVITDISIPFGEDTPKIILKQATHTSVKVGNNVLPVQNMTPLSEVFETNKLVIYDKEGTTLRGTYYSTTQGITTNANDPLRLPVTKTKYVFNTDDALNDIKQENLQEEIYNHKITFDLLLNNGLYDFYDWELGMPIEVWYNGEYYNTIFTKYSMSKDMNVDVTSVSVTCGKVRNTLTEKLNSYTSGQEQYVGSGSTEYYENPSFVTWNSSASTSDRTFQLWRYGNVITCRIAFNTNGAVANGASFTPITFSDDAVDIISATWREMFSVIDGGTYNGRVLISAVDTWNTTKAVYIWNNLGASLASGTRLLISFTWVI